MLKAAGLEYETYGNGDPVLFIHGGAIADADLPLMSQPALGPFRLIRYHRRGYGSSSPHTGHATFEEQAGDAARLLEALGVQRAHIVGHSYGGLIGLQLALDHQEVVHSLVLSEPALMVPTPGAPASGLPSSEATRHLEAGDFIKGIDTLFQRVGGAEWRASVETMIPGSSEQVDRDAPLTAPFEALPGELKLDSDLAKRITQPILSVRGTASGPRAVEVRQWLHSLLPQTEDQDVEGANHFVQFHNLRCTELMAEALARFFTKHPVH